MGACPPCRFLYEQRPAVQRSQVDIAGKMRLLQALSHHASPRDMVGKMQWHHQ